MKKTICCVLVVGLLSMAADTLASGMWSSTSRGIEPRKNEAFLASVNEDERLSGDEQSGRHRIIEYSNVIRITVFTPAPDLTSPASSTSSASSTFPVDVDENHTRHDVEEWEAQEGREEQDENKDGENR